MSQRLDEMDEDVQGRVMERAIEAARACLPRGAGAILVAYDDHTRPGEAQYIATGRRPDMARILRATADRIEPKKGGGR